MHYLDGMSDHRVCRCGMSDHRVCRCGMSDHRVCRCGMSDHILCKRSNLVSLVSGISLFNGNLSLIN